MDTRNTPIYNIKAVARLTGVAADTLRRWESRYQILAPQRSDGGYRMYSQQDVDTIKWLKTKVDEGLSISRASELLRSQTQSAANPAPVESYHPTRLPLNRQPVEETQGVQALETMRHEVLFALEHMDEVQAGQLLSEALSLYTVEQVLEQVIQPMLFEIGERWMSAEWTIAQEHFASAFIRGRIANMFHSSPFRQDGPLVLVACAPHELHEIGALVMALLLRRSGFKVIYLGQNVPVDSLVTMIRNLKPKAVCVSATRTETGANLPQLRQALEEMRAETGYAPVLAFGGGLFSRNPGLAERMGGHYLGGSASHAVNTLNGMITPVMGAA